MIVLFCLCCGVCFGCFFVDRAVVVGCCWSGLLYRSNENSQKTIVVCLVCLSFVCVVIVLSLCVFFFLGVCVWG